RQDFDGRSPQAIETDRGEHPCSSAIEPIVSSIAEDILPPIPVQPRGRTREPVEGDAVASDDFLEKPFAQDAARLHWFPIQEGRAVGYNRLIGCAGGCCLERQARGARQEESPKRPGIWARHNSLEILRSMDTTMEIDPGNAYASATN